MSTALRSALAAAALFVFVPAVAAPPSPAAARAAATARADIEKSMGFVPVMFDAVPDAALPSTWGTMKSLQMNPQTALSGKSKELVGLAVAAQIPCTYCVYAHQVFAKAAGANEQELQEATALAGVARMRSTMLTGMQYDAAALRADVERMQARRGPAPGTPIEVVDQATAFREAERLFGFVPGFLRAMPASAAPGVLRTIRDVQMADTALSRADKALVMIGVDAQTPCPACVAADLVVAKASGVSQAQIDEAIGMSALTRQMSTMLNGAQIDEQRFRREIDRLAAPPPAGASSSSKK